MEIDPGAASLERAGIPRLAPGRRRQWVWGDLRCYAVGVGPDRVAALAFGSRGHLPPPGQRAAMASLLSGRLRVLPSLAAEVPPARPFVDRALTTAADVISARQAIYEHLDPAVGPEQALRVVVAATEAMINAIRHGGGGRVAAWCAGGHLVVEVVDAGPGLPFARLVEAVLRPRGIAGSGLGYGYWLMLAYARSCEVAGGDGTRVRLRFALRGPRRCRGSRRGRRLAGEIGH